MKVLFALIIIILVVCYHYRYVLIYRTSLLLNTCEHTQKDNVRRCNGGLYVSDMDMSAPSNSLRLGFEWESWMEDYIKKYCKKDAIALDIGAHIGIHTRRMAQYSGMVIAFEPNPEIYNILLENTRNIPNIQIFNKAVNRNNGVVQFWAKDMNCQSEIVETFETKLNVSSIALDSFLQHVPMPISFIKIDIEGHEISAFEGMKALIQRYKPVIVFEDHTGKTKEYLRVTFGYAIHRVNTSNYLAL
jgi:FkbM family methyltransferase